MTSAPASTPRARPRQTLVFASATAVVAVGIVVAGYSLSRGGGPSRCADGFAELGTRCCGVGQRLDGDHCVGTPTRCGGRLDAEQDGCVAPIAKIPMAGGTLHFSAVDWEAEGRSAIADTELAPFAIDTYEVTWKRWSECASSGKCLPLEPRGDPGVPVTRVTAFEAARYCSFAGGSLPSSTQLLFASAGRDGRRFPWGPNGAVCRRAAWGLAKGPCAEGASGPDVTGSHPEGRTPEGAEDLAGNVAEWTLPRPDGLAEVRGGSFRDAEASALKTWSARLVAADSRHDDIGFRCVYPP